ncbi:MAG: peptidase M14 [Planctomycetes bacterium]|nr:peptidase M14 [Planctomycetota bacterium]
MNEATALLVCLGLALCVLAARAEGITVDSAFPGGNAVIEKVEGDEVVLHQDLRDTAGHWFWWHFRVRGAPGRTLTFRFTNGNVIGVRGPAVSTDGGKKWSWLGAAAVKGQTFAYAFPPDASEVRFCFAIPYFEADLKAFLNRWLNHPHLKLLSLCRSRKGREVERLHVGRLEPSPDHRILLTARHHCCESLASFAMEGVIEAMLADTPDGRWFRQHVEAMLIPFTDKDGVEDGDQGKNRKPHDHNRDYAEDGIYPETRALRDLAPKWADGRLKLAFDIHCPHIRGAHNEDIYIVGSEARAMWEQQCAFGKILEAAAAGPLPYRAASNLPYGKAWNTKANYGAGRSFSRWAGELPGVRLVASFELPYANAGGQTVTAETARAFGHDLAKAIRRYLEGGVNDRNQGG